MIALRYASIRVVYFTDCDFVRQTFERGPEYSSSGWFVYAGVWSKIWEHVSDIGYENVQVIWIPAHTSAKAVADGRITGLQRVCNAKADEQAKLGAGMHPQDESTAQRTQLAHGVVSQVGRYIGTINAIVGHKTPRDTTAKKAEPGNRQLHSMPRVSLRARKHSARLIGNRLRCTTCLRSAFTAALLAQLPCRMPGTRVVEHSVRCISNILFCSVCGSYSASRARGLQGSCPKEAVGTRARSLRRLLQGLHPKSGETLPSMTSERVVCLTASRGAEMSRRVQQALPMGSSRLGSHWQSCSAWGTCQCAGCQVLPRLAPEAAGKEDAMDSAADWGDG